MDPYPYSTPRRSLRTRLIFALIVAGMALASYYGQSEENSILGTTQRIAMTKGQEIALGLQSAPSMARQYGGVVERGEDQARVDRVGRRLLDGPTLRRSDYRYDFHLLADARTINAFALPGGQVFITRGLYDKLRTDGELAGVLGHEIGHVVARHGAQHLAKQRLSEGLAQAAGVATGDMSGTQLARMVGQTVNMRYGRGDELQSDTLGVRFMAEAGYDPRAMLAVMKILADASAGGRTPEFFSTHPNPENRTGVIRQAIAQAYPNGVPDGMER